MSKDVKDAKKKRPRGYHWTEAGRVVYDRERHPFKWTALMRICYRKFGVSIGRRDRFGQNNYDLPPERVAAIWLWALTAGLDALLHEWGAYPVRRYYLDYFTREEIVKKANAYWKTKATGSGVIPMELLLIDGGSSHGQNET